MTCIIQNKSIKLIGDLPLTAFVWLLLIELALTDPLNPGLTGTPSASLPPLVGGQPDEEPVWPGGEDFFVFRGDLEETIKKVLKLNC